MSALAYRPNNRLWVEVVFGTNRRAAHRKIVVFALLPFLIGCVISFRIGFLHAYLTNLAVYYAVLGIYLTVFSIWDLGERQYNVYDRFLTCFDLDARERMSLIKGTLSSYSNTKRQVRSAAVILLLATAIIMVGFWSKEIDALFPRWPWAHLFRFADFREAGWYESPNRFIALLLTWLFALWACLPLATAHRIMKKMPQVLKLCAEKPITILPRLIKGHFAPLTAFYTRVTILWSLGVLLFLLLFRANHNWLFWICSVFLIGKGIRIFVAPQRVYSRVSTRAANCWLDKVTEKCRELIAPKQQSPIASGSLLNMSGYFFSYDHWVYPIQETYAVLVAQLISLSGFSKIAVEMLHRYVKEN
jgi:hypothetical protein